MVPSRENTKFWQSISESDKSKLNMTQMIPTHFFSEITYDKDLDGFRYIPTGDYVRLWDDRNIIYQLENAINIIMPLTI